MYLKYTITSFITPFHIFKLPPTEAVYFFPIFGQLETNKKPKTATTHLDFMKHKILAQFTGIFTFLILSICNVHAQFSVKGTLVDSLTHES